MSQHVDTPLTVLRACQFQDTLFLLQDKCSTDYWRNWRRRSKKETAIIANEEGNSETHEDRQSAEHRNKCREKHKYEFNVKCVYIECQQQWHRQTKRQIRREKTIASIIVHLHGKNCSFTFASFSHSISEHQWIFFSHKKLRHADSFCFSSIRTLQCIRLCMVHHSLVVSNLGIGVTLYVQVPYACFASLKLSQHLSFRRYISSLLRLCVYWTSVSESATIQWHPTIGNYVQKWIKLVIAHNSG